MNNLYFACTSCKVFVDAGYRWAYFTLEEAGVVKQGTAVDAELVLAAQEYWSPEPDDSSKWLLEEVLPSVRVFLEQHRTHTVVFGDRDMFDKGPDWFLEWMQEGYGFDPLPRHCLERLGCQSWAAVCEHMTQLKFKPAWWTDPKERERAEGWYRAQLIRALGAGARRGGGMIIPGV